MKTFKQLALATVLATTTASVNALVLDTFDYELDLEVNAANLVDTSIETTLLGADAVYTLTYPAAGDTSSEATADTVDVFSVSDDELAFASAGDTPSTLSITWTDLDAVTPLDFTAFGDHIYIDLISVDLAFMLDLTVSWFDTGSLSVVDTVFSTVVDDSFAEPSRILYSFNNWAGADFTKVTAVTADIAGVPDADFRLAEVGVIPEPSTLAMLGLGLLGFAATRKSKV